MYFLAWSVSFYPQIWENFKRKRWLFDIGWIFLVLFQCHRPQLWLPLPQHCWFHPLRYLQHLPLLERLHPGEYQDNFLTEYTSRIYLRLCLYHFTSSTLSQILLCHISVPVNVPTTLSTLSHLGLCHVLNSVKSPSVYVFVRSPTSSYLLLCHIFVFLSCLQLWHLFMDVPSACLSHLWLHFIFALNCRKLAVPHREIVG